ncbi:MAG: tetratricopeptide repeat protein [Steroidobacteraceae bacterium]
MTIFVLICVFMLLVALGLIAVPLLKGEAIAELENKPRNRYAVLVLTTLSVSVMAAGLYMHASNWQWGASATAVGGQAPTDSAEIGALLQQLKTSPDNLEARLSLAQAYTAAGSYVLAGQAYEQAYNLSNGQNIDAVTGLLEALVLTDQGSVNGRAALLVDEAFKLQANNPKALWYGGLVALQSENLSLARDRFKTLLAMSPPDSIRMLLERQVQDLDEQLNAAGSAVPAAVKSERKITVQVRLSAGVKQQLTQPVSLFILARNPQQPGPPLAVERHGSDELPLNVELSVADAMLPTRTLNDADTVQVVARLSASGSPAEQSGDWYGAATYSFATQGEQGSVTIEITQRVP